MDTRHTGHGDRSDGASDFLAAKFSRRQLMMGAAATSIVVAGGAAGHGSWAAAAPTAAPKVARYRSRPDLKAPAIDVRRRGVSRPSGYVFVTPTEPLIVGDDGEPVWIHPSGTTSTDLKVQRYNGKPVLTWWQGEAEALGVGIEGVNVIMDQSYRVIERVYAGNGLQADAHDFVVTARGTAFLPAYHVIHADLTSIGGPKSVPTYDCVVQEVDISSGKVLFEWHSAQHVSLEESYKPYIPGTDRVYDPFHLNSIQELPGGQLLISARNTWTIYTIDMKSGAIVWRLGGKRSTFALGPGARFAWQHDARRHPSGAISLFDDESFPHEATQSRGLVLTLDRVKKTATVAREYDHPGTGLLSSSQGNTQLLDGGGALVGWGSQPYYTQYDAHGRWVLDAKFGTGFSYRAFRFPWRATPTDRPAVVVERAGLDTYRSYVSWNGATEVASWSARTGPSPRAHLAAGVAPRSGFETNLLIHRPGRFLVLDARDAKGAVIGSSRPIRLPG